MIIYNLERNLVTSIINIKGINVDLKKSEEVNISGSIRDKITKEGEFCRLFLEVLGYPAQTKAGFDIDGNPITINIPERIGINLSTATFNQIKEYLNSPPAKVSESIRELCRKVMAQKFPTRFDAERLLISENLKQEYFLIKNESLQRTDMINILGECGGGILGKVRLDDD